MIIYDYMSPFESFGRKLETDNHREQEAEKALDIILNEPDNSFLTTIESNREAIENSESAIEALQFAEAKLKERLSRTSEFQTLNTIEGIHLTEVDFGALKQTVDTILFNQMEIGRGGDAFVVVDRNEIREFPPEICYKFALAEATPRGRNSTKVEAELQGLFYDIAQGASTSKIGIPMPFYMLEIGGRKMIAMEKLEAKSIDDILRGKGHLPSWFDVESFCVELQRILDHFHANGLYHRDMHFGNVMISQKETLEPGEKWGFVIDFGLSGMAREEQFAYEKQVAGATFTYSSDYGIISEVKKELSELQNRESWGK